MMPEKRRKMEEKTMEAVCAAAGNSWLFCREMGQTCCMVWPSQRWLWHLRDTRVPVICGFAAIHPSWVSRW